MSTIPLFFSGTTTCPQNTDSPTSAIVSSSALEACCSKALQQSRLQTAGDHLTLSSLSLPIHPLSRPYNASMILTIRLYSIFLTIPQSWPYNIWHISIILTIFPWSKTDTHWLLVAVCHRDCDDLLRQPGRLPHLPHHRVSHLRPQHPRREGLGSGTNCYHCLFDPGRESGGHLGSAWWLCHWKLLWGCRGGEIQVDLTTEKSTSLAFIVACQAYCGAGCEAQWGRHGAKRVKWPLLKTFLVFVIVFLLLLSLSLSLLLWPQ